MLHFHRLLSQALKSAYRKRLIVYNPMNGVEAVPKPEEREIQVLSDPEMAALFRIIKGKSLYLPVMLAASTGMRRGEILALRWRDTDFDAGKLTVQQSLEQTKAGLRFKPPKTKRSRRGITLPSRLVEELREHKRRQSEKRVAQGLGRDRNDLVFTTPDGQPRSPVSFTKDFSRTIKAANKANDDAGKPPALPEISLHALRHTHITNLLAQGVHAKVVSERAGHANVGITLGIYAHVIPGLEEGAAVLVDASIRAALED